MPSEPEPERRKRKQAIPERFEDFLGYFRERAGPAAAFNVDREAEKCFDHYEANGWVQNRRVPIKDWRAAVRNWIRRIEEFSSTRAPSSSLDRFVKGG